MGKKEWSVKRGKVAEPPGRIGGIAAPKSKLSMVVGTTLDWVAEHPQLLKWNEQDSDAACPMTTYAAPWRCEPPTSRRILDADELMAPTNWLT